MVIGLGIMQLSWNRGVVFCLEINVVDSLLELVQDEVDLVMLKLLLVMVVSFFFEVGIEVVRFIENVENVIFQLVFVFDEGGFFGKEIYVFLIILVLDVLLMEGFVFDEFVQLLIVLEKFFFVMVFFLMVFQVVNVLKRFEKDGEKFCDNGVVDLKEIELVDKYSELFNGFQLFILLVEFSFMVIEMVNFLLLIIIFVSDVMFILEV